MIRSYKDLKVFLLSYELAMDIFWLTKKFPREEMFSLTDQVRRSSRSVPGNIVEGWAKRRYESIFKRHLIDSIGSCDETKLWLAFAKDCRYISEDEQGTLTARYDEVGKMLRGLFDSWRTFVK